MAQMMNMEYVSPAIEIKRFVKPVMEMKYYSTGDERKLYCGTCDGDEHCGTGDESLVCGTGD